MADSGDVHKRKSFKRSQRFFIVGVVDERDP
jgi:hypothetical protein